MLLLDEYQISNLAKVLIVLQGKDFRENSSKIDFKLDDKSLKTIINDYFNSKLFIENYNIDKTKTNEDFELIKNIYKSIK